MINGSLGRNLLSDLGCFINTDEYCYKGKTYKFLKCKIPVLNQCIEFI